MSFTDEALDNAGFTRDQARLLAAMQEDAQRTRDLLLETQADLLLLRTALNDTLAAMEMARTGEADDETPYHAHALAASTRLMVRTIRRGLDRDEGTTAVAV